MKIIYTLLLISPLACFWAFFYIGHILPDKWIEQWYGPPTAGTMLVLAIISLAGFCTSMDTLCDEKGS